MAATAEQVAQVRRMTAEPTTTTYTDTTIAAMIEAHALVDENGASPKIWSSVSGNLTTNPDWTPTYDLAAAAADIWEEKAAALTSGYDFSADGDTYQRSQMHVQALAQARFFRSRRSPTTVRLTPDMLALSERTSGSAA